MPYDFDRVVDRRAIPNLNKWKFYDDDVLPLWVADMDFRTPAPLLEAVTRAVDHGILGYELTASQLFEKIAVRLASKQGWVIDPQAIVPIPNISVGYRVAAALLAPGSGVVIQPPVFHDFIHFPADYGHARQDAPLRRAAEGRVIHYALDFAAVEQAIASGAVRAGMLLLCNPHNPVGHVFSREELAFLGRLCLEHDLLLCSDDAHSDIILGDGLYAPIAALSPDIAAQSITLIGPGKGFNCSGFACAFAIIPHEGRREAFKKELERIALLYPGSPGAIVAAAAYSSACDEWQLALRDYLTANRDFVVDFVRAELPGVSVTRPAGTYLAWLDFSEHVASGQISGAPFDFFLERARVALSDGAPFGPGGEGHVRLNFATSRAILAEALERMARALRATA